MSLLLDALKKAAEQKAEKSRQETTPATPLATPADETEIAAAAEDISALEQGAGHGLEPTPRNLEDETELDDSEIQTRLERTDVERKAVEDTELEVSDATDTRSPVLSEQMRTGEDETIIFDAEDVSDFLGEPALISRESQDETDLSQLASDATDLSQVAPSEDAAEPTDEAAREDDTDISQPFQPEAPIAAEQQVDSEDETEISQFTQQADTTAQPEEPTSIEETDLGRDDDVEASEVDDDMSLLLVDHDETNLTGRTSQTDRQTAEEIAQALESDAAGIEDLALVDTTQHQIPEDVTQTAALTQSSTTATTRNAPETQVTQGTNTRLETTSTRTYAPDNYDRTLMRLPSEDASKLFAGMKTDSDVVMTPDYAKKVFRSKSSAQRREVYKVYGGIAIVILLSIGIFGAFEFQDESNSIDSSLRPLKRDPMPGIIKPEDISEQSNLFAESGTSARTIEIIENADNADAIIAADEGVITDQTVIADEIVAVDETTPTQDVEISETVVEVDDSPDASTVTDSAQVALVETTQNAESSQAEAPAAQATDNSSTLKIETSSQVRQKDLWLREAYDAYKSGDDKLALTLYNKVLKVDPGNRNALLARAAINVQGNNSVAAIKDYQTLLVLNPKDSLAMTSLLTVANYLPQETESRLKLMIRDEPDSPYLNFALANAYSAQNRWQEAQGYYFRALENNPGDPNYAYNLAVSLEHIAQPLAAVGYYQRALENINNGLATFSREIVSQRMETLTKK